MKPYAIFCLSCVAGVLLAAEWPKEASIQHAYLEVILANKTLEDVDEAGVYFGKFPCTKGIIGAGYSGGYLGWQQPVTTNVVVKWRNARGVRKEQAIGLANVYDPKVDGALTFTIGATNVTVAFKKIDRR